jgi:hypothetical protein
MYTPVESPIAFPIHPIIHKPYASSVVSLEALLQIANPSQALLDIIRLLITLQVAYSTYQHISNISKTLSTYL